MKRPPFLYRYRSLAGSERAKAEQIVVQSQLYFASPVTFNDPFEARFDDQRGSQTDFPARLRQGLTNEVGACCFSAPKDNLLLWAHYADSHRGVCLEFSTTHPDSLLVHADPVEYSHAFPVVDFGNGNSPDRARMVFFRKARDWMYEQEWRLFDTTAAPGPRRFAPAILTGIILGCATGSEERDLVRSWIQARALPVALMQARIRPHAYAVDIEPLDATVA